MLIPPGIPLWFYPGMATETGAKDIANQPALIYARMIAALRSLIGEQITNAVNLELELNFGRDWVDKNAKFDIIWPNWFVSGLESGMMQPDQAQSNSQESQPDANNRLIKHCELLLSEPSREDLPAINLALAQIDELISHAKCSDGQFAALWSLGVKLHETKSALAADS